jgi:hypothetical protein
LSVDAMMVNCFTLSITESTHIVVELNLSLTDKKAASKPLSNVSALILNYLKTETKF